TCGLLFMDPSFELLLVTWQEILGRPVSARYGCLGWDYSGVPGRARERIRKAMTIAPNPREENARPQASGADWPPARSSTTPNTGGATNPAPKPSIECTAMVAPRMLSP